MHITPIHSSTDYGLRTLYQLIQRFFFENLKLSGLGRQIGSKIIGAVGVFLAKISAPILGLWVTCPCFPLSLYIHIQNIYLVLGYEFGPQRIRDVAFVCPQSVHSSNLKAILYRVKDRLCIFSVVVIVILAMFTFQLCPKVKDKQYRDHYDYDRKNKIQCPSYVYITLYHSI